MDFAWLNRVPVKVFLSILFALVISLLLNFLVGFVIVGRVGFHIYKFVSPMFTAVGFTTGIALCEHLAKVRNSKFIYILFWPLIGCTASSIVGFWLLPGWVGIIKYAAGTVSVILREALQMRKEQVTRAQVRIDRKQTGLIVFMTSLSYVILIIPWIIMISVFAINPNAHEDPRSSVGLLFASFLFRFGSFCVFGFAGYALIISLTRWQAGEITKTIFILLLLVAILWAAVLFYMLWFMEFPA